MTVIEFESEVHNIAEHFVSTPVAAVSIAFTKTRLLAALAKLYDAGGCVHDCYKQPIERFEDVDLLVHYIEMTRTLQVSVARREIANADTY